jgi:UPF0716 protein FxsA
VRRIQDEMAAGKMPTDSLIDGAMVLVAGIFLVTPGVLTDLTGLALLVPPLRRAIKAGMKVWLARHVQVRAAKFTAGFATDGQGSPSNPPSDRIVEAKVIDTRVEDVP